MIIEKVLKIVFTLPGIGTLIAGNTEDTGAVENIFDSGFACLHLNFPCRDKAAHISEPPISQSSLPPVIAFTSASRSPNFP